jgi:hypothetical protein
VDGKYKGGNFMADINTMSPASGRVLKEDNTTINMANLAAPDSNGDQTITITAAGVFTLTPPYSNNIAAIIIPPVDIWIRYGATPSLGIGLHIFAYQGVILDSPAQSATAQIYVTAPCTLFVQYEK